VVDIAVSPFVLRDCTLKIGADNYEAHVSQVQFNPSSSTQTWKGLTPTAVFTDVTTATWTCTLAYAQDWTTPDSLSLYLHEHEGDEVEVVFVPRKGSGQPSIEAALLITPGAIGGTVDAFATASVTVGVNGKPEIVPAA
jgi:hypothetical protein